MSRRLEAKKPRPNYSGLTEQEAEECYQEVLAQGETFVGHGEFARIVRYCLERGDRKPLVNALLTLDPCPKEVTQIAAEYIVGKIKLPKGEPQNFSLQDQAWPGVCVLQLLNEGEVPKNALADVAKALNISKRKVQTSLAFCRRLGIKPGRNVRCK